MKPEQFIRWFGIEDAKYLIEQNINCNDFEFSLEDLKRLMESLDLIKFYDGIEKAKLKLAMCTCLSGRPPHPREVELRQAIRDHESIYGGGDES
ncbi:hypothetical protein QDR98_17255 [Acinetobacter baumannii]|uniref:hypothetical protein n=1 Tax=Acinetobacter baumannii TaxID=470 RepID=UPI0024494E3D|nr:hypothetical protein [Acinetobacter baumannii]MDH2667664.1 hypothetical protein [Acinetobacter baumannii]